MELGQRVERARKARGMAARADFVRALGAERSTVERWEAGKGGPDAVWWEPISRVTGVSIDWLVKGFVSPSWQPTFATWLEQNPVEDAERIWLESLPLEGFEPNPRFYDYALLAKRHHLSVAKTIEMAVENLDLDREVSRQLDRP